MRVIWKKYKPKGICLRLYSKRQAKKKIVPELLIRKVKVENARNALRNVVSGGGMYDGLIKIHNKGQLPPFQLVQDI